MHDLNRHRRLTPFPQLHPSLHFCGALPVAAVCFTLLANAQTPTPQAVSPDVQATARAARHRAAPAQKTPAIEAAPTAPPAPDWPINDQPTPAAIAWTSPDLRIDARNSSLHQILTDVSTATGAEVEGFAGDQRVFGDFGPGSAHDVLAQLLQGTGYNIVMVGDRGQGVPREIILSERNASKTPSGPTRPAPEENDEDVPDYPQYEPPPPAQQQTAPPPQAIRPGFPPDASAPGRLPQQIQQQMQQLQQQQQQQGQPAQQPNPQQ